MARSIIIKAERAEAAVTNLAQAEKFEQAERHWSDFLVYWYQTLELCDAAAGRAKWPGRVPWKTLALADPAMNYLLAARNADHHTLIEIVEKSESALSIGALGGYDVEVLETRPGCLFPDMRFTPQTDDPPPVLAFIPETIRLLPITGRTPVAVPSAYDYDLGETSAPVALALAGLAFMRAQVDAVLGQSSTSAS